MKNPQNEIQHVLSGKEKIGKIITDYEPIYSHLENDWQNQIQKILQNPKYNGTPYAALLKEFQNNAAALGKNFEIIEHLFLSVLNMRLNDSIYGGCFYYFDKIIPNENGEGGNIIFSNEIENAVENIRKILIGIADKVKPLSIAFEKETEAQK